MKRSRKAFWRGLLGLALLAGVVALVDVAALRRLLAAADLGLLFVGLGAALVSNLLSAWRWCSLARWLGCELTARHAVRWYFQGMGLNALLPGAVVGGDVFRAMALRRQGQPTGPATWSVLLDRLSGLWMLCAIGALGGAASADALAQVVGWAPAVVRGLALLAVFMWVALPFGLAPWLRQRRVRGWLAPLSAAAEHPDFGRQLLWQAMASCGVQVFSALALACGGMALGLWLAPGAWAFAVAPVFLMAALPVSVGGWGTREAAAVAALAPFGAPAAAAVGAAMVYGLYGVVQALLGAAAFGLPASEFERSS